MDAFEGLLTPAQRERRDLGYLTFGPTFGENFLTKLHGPTEEKGLGPGPQVTFYAQPTAPSTPIDLGKLSTWLDPNLRRYEPATALQFIPHYRRGIADGIVATTDEPGGSFDRFIAVRRSGSVEYGASCSWVFQRGTDRLWLLHLKQVVLQFAQFIGFLDDLSSAFGLPRPWTVWCSARHVQGIVLSGLGQGWADWFERPRPSTSSLEDQFQLELSFAGGSAAVAAAIDDLAGRFELAFGSTTPRAYDRSGNTLGAISFSDVQYS